MSNEVNEFKTWDKFAKDSLVLLTEFIIEEGHSESDYTYAESCIMSSLTYLKRKRSARKDEPRL